MANLRIDAGGTEEVGRGYIMAGEADEVFSRTAMKQEAGWRDPCQNCRNSAFV
jgi:hypothetical protein